MVLVGVFLGGLRLSRWLEGRMRLLGGALRNWGRRLAFGTPPLGPMRAEACTIRDSGRPMWAAPSPPRIPGIFFLFLWLLLFLFFFLLAQSPMPVTMIPPRFRRATVSPARFRRFVAPRARTCVVPPRTAPSVVRIRMSPRRPCRLLSGGVTPSSISGRLPSAFVVRRSPWVLARHIRPSVHISVNCEQDQLLDTR